MKELRACPFCGSNPNIIITNKNRLNGQNSSYPIEFSLIYSIECEYCTLKIDGFHTEKDLVDFWNCRSTN